MTPFQIRLHSGWRIQSRAAAKISWCWRHIPSRNSWPSALPISWCWQCRPNIWSSIVPANSEIAFKKISLPEQVTQTELKIQKTTSHCLLCWNPFSRHFTLYTVHINCYFRSLKTAEKFINNLSLRFLRTLLLFYSLFLFKQILA